MKIIITFGTYDLFHVGHLNLLKRAAAMGDILIVGVSTDSMNFDKKKRYPIYCLEDRMKIISGLRYVNFCFPEESLDLKEQYIKKYNADILVMGDDWEGKFDHLNKFCTVKYLKRTPSVSTSEVIEVVKSGLKR